MGYCSVKNIEGLARDEFRQAEGISDEQTAYALLVET